MPVPNIIPLVGCLRNLEKYSEKDLVSFGNFMRSKLRDKYHTEKIKAQKEIDNVWDNDLSNWRQFTNNGKKTVDYSKILAAIK